MENFPDFAHDAAEHWQYTGKAKKTHSFVVFDKAFTDPFYQLTAKQKDKITDAAALLQQWLGQLATTKDDGAIPVAPPAEPPIPKEKDKKKSNIWNVVGISIAVVGVGLIGWGIMTYMKTQKAKAAVVVPSA